MPELPGNLRLQAGTRRAELRFLRLARARSLRGNQGADPPGEPAAVQAEPGRRARQSARLVPRAAGSRPIASRARAFTDTIHGLYLPYWTFDAQVAAQWTAEAGYYYYTTETYRDSKGDSTDAPGAARRAGNPRAARSSISSTTNWCPLRAACRRICCDGSSRSRPSELAPYDAGYISGWVVEQYQIDLVAAAQHSREAMDAKLRQLCAAQIPGDTHRNLEVEADYSAQTFKHVLLPVWLLSYQYGGTTYRIVANGLTGALAGKYPKSWIKIGLLVLAILIVLLLIFVYGEG